MERRQLDNLVGDATTDQRAEPSALPRISFDGFVLFDTIRIAAAATTGFSFTTDSIGRERERELAYGGSARALIYFGPEIIISMVNHPELEFVYREQHRSGANGTFGKCAKATTQTYSAFDINSENRTLSSG
jgi:hypothetical protein